MHRGRKSKGLPAENPRAFGERAAPSQLWRGGRLCAHTHVQEDTHVCTPCQGPVLTRRGGTLPRPGEEEEEEEGDAISGSLPTPAAKGTTPHTPPPSRCLHAWVSARSVIPSTPRRHLDREKAMQNQTKTHQNTPKQPPPQDLMEALAAASSRAPCQRAAQAPAASCTHSQY